MIGKNILENTKNKTDILSEIVDKRKADMAALGISFGCDVPEKRTRRVVPFLQNAGVILEIKRASPSKGDIAPQLDAAATATAYQAAGARAISVLTEKNYFKGTLKDLMAASAAATETAILRKDFILLPEEIGVSYLCGADAVLLIARILEQNVLDSCIAECIKFGMTAFVEVRTEDDVQKINAAKLKLHNCGADENVIVCGVNARDLATFSIDPLVPAAMKEKLGGRVVSESGILTPSAAEFTGSMGFHGILVGEAAARDVESAHNIVTAFENNSQLTIHNAQLKNINARWWRNVAQLIHNSELKIKNCKKPLVKICGLTNVDDALCAAKNGADFLGFIFAAKSPRCVKAENVREIINAVKNSEKAVDCKFVGVIVDEESTEGKEAISLVEEGVLDAIQFHGCGINKNVSGYAAVRVGNMGDIDKVKKLALEGQPRILIDAFVENEAGGTGKRISDELVDAARKVRPLWLAGGITPDNVTEIVEKFMPELIDVSSGLETSPGKKDCEKIVELLGKLKSEK